ncbi:MAG: SDR family oxidoreductase [Aeromicrobium sp.]|uniref:SDR family oxidoreductase n=1 Tax=Aeromicrobium sp. TaxID=1871063 RepID=UPI003C5E01FF
MDLGLRDRTYILTGATNGLGLATAEALVADGARVVVSSRTQSSVDSAVAALGDQATGVAADNRDPSTPARLVAAAHERFGRLDGALISVGGPPAGTVLDTTDELWAEAFETVFVGSLRLARTIATELGEGGAIAFVLSTSAKMPVSGLAISNGLRPGLAMAAKTMADELGPRGVRVNGLLPGRLETARVQHLDSLADDPVAARAAHEAAIPLRRYGTPEEFGRVAAFVLSPAASFVTGTMLAVDGGLVRGL